MTKTRVFLIVQAVLCVLLVVLLSAAAVGIYREGTARKAEDPLEKVYTPQNTAEKFAPIAPLLFLSAGMTIAGLLLSLRDERAEKPVRDAEITRDLTAGRVLEPSDGMRKERKLQRRLLWAGWGGFAACMVPLAFYLTRAEHFPPGDLEGMFYGLLRVFLPWTAAGIGCLVLTGALIDRNMRRETEEAKSLPKADRKPAFAPGAPEKKDRRPALQKALIVLAVGLIVLGIFNGSALDVLYKAIKICTECVGLG